LSSYDFVVSHVGFLNRSAILFSVNLYHTESVIFDSTSCLPMIGGSPRLLRLLPPLKLVATI